MHPRGKTDGKVLQVRCLLGEGSAAFELHGDMPLRWIFHFNSGLYVEEGKILATLSFLVAQTCKSLSIKLS